ncbi:hypothetical protein [[Leptolyngbya] sp. PCC 7376]|nr:hypothetical protein [[Leptolyngbya] sp. PCC 7376]
MITIYICEVRMLYSIPLAIANQFFSSLKYFSAAFLFSPHNAKT